MVNHPVDRPETAPYDFRKHAIPEVPDLAGFRVFTRTVAVLQIEDGKYKVLSNGFIDILRAGMPAAFVYTMLLAVASIVVTVVAGPENLSRTRIRVQDGPGN